jgi:cobyrinic acid a,c-diamide synthase
MPALPRFAIGAVQPHCDTLPMLWALGEVCERRGLHVQNYLSRSCLVARHGGTPLSISARHLDSWLMCPEVCREIFVHGSRSCDLAIVEGRFDAARDAGDTGGGSLDELCQWLDLPRVAVLDVSCLDACRLPMRPVADALLLDRIGSSEEFARLQTRLESLWGIPIVGGLERLDDCRTAMKRLASGEIPSRKVTRALAGSLAKTLRLEKLRSLATERCFPPVTANRLSAGQDLAEVSVAVAYDEIFNCYFPDTLDLLELQGAKVSTFSPLHDEGIPEGTDVVYLGCGHPENADGRLGANLCMRSSLCEHVIGGGRVYAEGGGLAYLCESIDLGRGRFMSMAGLIPAIARLNMMSPPPEPVAITLAQGNWLGEGWSQLRGYLNKRWDIVPTGHLTKYAAETGHELDLVGTAQAVGSRIHLNFAAQPEFLRAFFAPHPPSMAVSAID